MSGEGGPPRAGGDAPPGGNDRALLHELRVHQLELEIQNEELRRVQVDLERSRSRYFETYDLAPIGLCTVDEGGAVVESNLTLATMLGKRRGSIDAQPFARLVLDEDRDALYLMQRRMFERGMLGSCELRLVTHDGGRCRVRLEGVMARDDAGAPVCRLSVSDISRERLDADPGRAPLDAYVAALDAVTSCVAVLDAEGVVMLVNDAWRRHPALVATRDVVGLHHVVAWGSPSESPFRHDAAAVLVAIAAVLAGAAERGVACGAVGGEGRAAVRVLPASGGHGRVVVMLDDPG